MELKFMLMIKDVTVTPGSNRTFMELKSRNLHELQTLGGVLIVPLWN